MRYVCLRHAFFAWRFFLCGGFPVDQDFTGQLLNPSTV
jgi:hypothetical protein